MHVCTSVYSKSKYTSGLTSNVSHENDAWLSNFILHIDEHIAKIIPIHDLARANKLAWTIAISFKKRKDFISACFFYRCMCFCLPLRMYCLPKILNTLRTLRYECIRCQVV